MWHCKWLLKLLSHLLLGAQLSILGANTGSQLQGDVAFYFMCGLFTLLLATLSHYYVLIPVGIAAPDISIYTLI